MTERNRLLRQLGAPVAAAALLLAAMATFAIFYFSRPLVIAVRNIGTQDMHRVIVFVTGDSQPLGDIGAGDEATTPVTPTGDSHVEIEWTEPTGKRARQTAGCYFGPGFSGRIEVHVADGKIRAIVDDTDI